MKKGLFEVASGMNHRMDNYLVPHTKSSVHASIYKPHADISLPHQHQQVR